MCFHNTFRQCLRIHCKTVVHGRDFNFACFMLFHGVVGTVMAVVHFDGFGTKCKCQHLVPQANSKDGDHALALGAKTVKMNHGHHGANHPVKDVHSNKVEITSMNHGFTVDSQSLPEGVVETHISLFDGSNCGIRMADRPVFSVQYHPEASPGPQDSFYLFENFAAEMEKSRAA